ncbi:MAG TPA: HNH endonuclease [Candidatus Ruania gallistercoris]|uniref:HNH endonuclease n=1 Tax=Candidatus Ruania gallistercoris TaxID=2838746 RepID=A0A9D2J548_9MICO|nr:HNH endonuclease [Candidatus Ruania gallistercoris]
MEGTGDFITLEGRDAAQWEGADVLERLLSDTLAEFRTLSVDERLARMDPRGALLEKLLHLDLDEVDEATLVEVIAAGNRLASCAQALMCDAAGRLAERELMNPAALAEQESDAETGTTSATGVDKGCTAPEELAPRLGWTRNQCRDLTRRGRTMCSSLTNTGTDLRTGRIDTARAHAIIDGLQDVAWQVAMAVEDQVLPSAPERTAGQLRRDIARALVAVDPAEAEARAARRQSRRRVSRPRALGDETAAMTIQGPAADVLALDQALHARAKAAKADGDTRTMDQLRFDTLAAVGSHALATGYLGPKELSLPLGLINGRHPEIHVTIPLTHLTPRTGTAKAGDEADTGTSTGDHVADEAGILHRILTTPPPSSPGCTCGMSSSSGLEAPWYLPGESVIDTGPSITSDAVPYLSGYGPITPATARALAAGGIWRRLVTDPVTDQLLDLGHTRYRPSAALADHVRARDTTCVRPGCSTAARECQLDHTEPWDHTDPSAGGATAPANLGPLCQRDHQTKTHGDFQLEQSAPGVFEWTTPTGHRYRREPDGSTTALSHNLDAPPPF